jgi:glucose/mannose transport system permease protein
MNGGESSHSIGMEGVFVNEAEASQTLSKGRFRRQNKGQLLPVFLIMPSAVAIIVFIYGFILFTLWTSLSRWSSPVMNLNLREPAWATYAQMFGMGRWQCDLRNLVVFTVLFLIVAIGVGLLMAILLDRKLIGTGMFRNVFLFPYALSFIVTGVAWRWIFNPEAGVNLLFNAFGINHILASFGAPPLKPGWITDPSVLFSVNDILAKVFPGTNDLAVQIGIPVALIPLVIAASWQLSGFAMAMYIAGLSIIPHELREAARIDGASELQVYTRIILPQLWPVTVSLMIILGHISLKIFDLVFAMTGAGPGFATDVPGVFVFEQTFKAIRYNTGAAASMVMLALVAIVIVPYFWGTLRRVK